MSFVFRCTRLFAVRLVRHRGHHNPTSGSNGEGGRNLSNGNRSAAAISEPMVSEVSRWYLVCQVVSLNLGPVLPRRFQNSTFANIENEYAGRPGEAARRPRFKALFCCPLHWADHGPGRRHQGLSEVAAQAGLRIQHGPPWVRPARGPLTRKPNLPTSCAARRRPARDLPAIGPGHPRIASSKHPRRNVQAGRSTPLVAIVPCDSSVSPSPGQAGQIAGRRMGGRGWPAINFRAGLPISARRRPHLA